MNIKQLTVTCIVALTGLAPALADENVVTFSPTGSSTHTTEYVASDVSLPGASDFTWEAWVKPSDLTLAENRIMGQTDWTSEGRLIVEVRKGNNDTGGVPKLALMYRVGGANKRLVSTTELVADTWYHVAVTRIGTALSIYVDGALEASASDYAGPLPSVPFTFANAYSGSLAEVRVWNYARTASGIREAMRRRFDSAPSGLVGRWPLESNVGNRVTEKNAAVVGYGSAVSYGVDSGLTLSANEVAYGYLAINSACVNRYGIDSSGTWTFLNTVATNGDGHCTSPYSVKYRNGTVYVLSVNTEPEDTSLLMYTPGGEFLGTAATTVDAANSRRTGDSFAISPDGQYAYWTLAAGTMKHRLARIVLSSGALALQWISGLTTPRGIDCDSSGNIYVVSQGDNAVYMYSPSGTLMQTYSCEFIPRACAVDSDNGRLFVVGTTTGYAVFNLRTGMTLASGEYDRTLNSHEMACCQGKVYAASWNWGGVATMELNGSSCSFTRVFQQGGIEGLDVVTLPGKNAAKAGEAFVVERLYGVHRYGIAENGTWTYLNTVAEVSDGRLPPYPTGVAVHEDMVYVAACQTNYNANGALIPDNGTSIVVYTRDGAYVKTLVSGLAVQDCPIAVSGDGAYIYLGAYWGANGNVRGKVYRYSTTNGIGGEYLSGFNRPRGVACVGSTALYVAARDDHKVYKYLTGDSPNLIATYELPAVSNAAFTPVGLLRRDGELYVTGFGQMAAVCGAHSETQILWSGAAGGSQSYGLGAAGDTIYSLAFGNSTLFTVSENAVSHALTFTRKDTFRQPYAMCITEPDKKGLAIIIR